MLRMDGFTYHHAASPEAAVALWSSLGDARYIAGGTDLLPNIKHRILQPGHLIGIAAALPAGWRTEDDGQTLIIGAGTRLSRLATLPQIPALAAAARLIAGPQIRNMGTLGGNILLDTRCLFYNQSAFWRQALGHCLKAEGDWCHVIGGPKTCVATQSADTVPMLLVLDASVRLLGPDGARTIALRDLYRFNGMDHLQITPGELLTEVCIPLPPADTRATYKKLRTRDAIDIPQLSLAVCGRFSGTGPAAVAHTLEIVVGAVNPQPRPVKKLEAHLGQPLDDDRIEAISQLVYRSTRPVAAVHGDPGWRRHMSAVYTRRALRELRDMA